MPNIAPKARNEYGRVFQLLHNPDAGRLCWYNKDNGDIWIIPPAPRPGEENWVLQVGSTSRRSASQHTFCPPDAEEKAFQLACLYIGNLVDLKLKT